MAITVPGNIDCLVSLLEGWKNGHGLEDWWRNRFGFENLTESEVRYLVRTENADTIRNRIAAAEKPGGQGARSKILPDGVTSTKPLKAAPDGAVSDSAGSPVVGEIGADVASAIRRQSGKYSLMRAVTTIRQAEGLGRLISSPRPTPMAHGSLSATMNQRRRSRQWNSMRSSKGSLPSLKLRMM